MSTVAEVEGLEALLIEEARRLDVIAATWPQGPVRRYTTGRASGLRKAAHLLGERRRAIVQPGRSR